VAPDLSEMTIDLAKTFYPRSKPIKAFRTDRCSDKSQEVELRYEIRNYMGKQIFHLLGGPTGFENFVVSAADDTIYKTSTFGWLACAGTPGVYDKLFITADEMKRVFKEEGFL
jgi:hypothetical protein